MSKIRWSDAAIKDSSGILCGGMTDERQNGHAGRGVRQTISSLVSVTDHRKRGGEQREERAPTGTFGKRSRIRIFVQIKIVAHSPATSQSSQYVASHIHWYGKDP